MIIPKRGDRHTEVSALCRPLLTLIAILSLAIPASAQSIGGNGISGGNSVSSGVQIGGDIGGTNSSPTISKIGGATISPLATQALPATAAQGGTGLISPAAHSLVQSEGASAVNLITAAVAGDVILDQGSGLDFAEKALSGDCTITSAGVITCPKASGVSFGPLATQTTPCSIGQGCTGTSSTLSGFVVGGNPLTAGNFTGDVSNTGLATTVAKVNGNTPGNTCTNQFTRSIDSSARGTCATVVSTDTDTSIAHTGVDINTSHQVVNTHLSNANALPLAQGGTACKVAPGLYASRDGSPTAGEQCWFTDGTCTAGTPVAGTGPGCWGTWVSPNWMPAGNAASAASGGVQIGGDIGGTVSTPLVTKLGGATISPLATQAIPATVAQGGTNATTAAGARTSLGLTAMAIEPFPTAGVPGNLATLIPKTDTLPITSATLACLNPTGVYPDTHWYSGLTPGTTTALAYTLPASGCVDNATIGVKPVQHGTGATADTVTFLAAGGSTLAGPTCPGLGTAAGNTITCKFHWNAPQSQWIADTSVGTVPTTAPAVGLSTFVDAGSPYSPLSSDQMVDCNCSSGACQLNVPQAGNQALKRRYEIKNISSTQLCNVHPFAGDSINGSTSDLTLGTNETVSLQERAATFWDKVLTANASDIVSGTLDPSHTSGITESLPNSGVGTTINKVAIVTGGQAQIAGLGASVAVQGVCIKNCTTTGNAIIQTTGSVGCVFTGSAVSGDYVQTDSTTAGNCLDAGITPPTTGGMMIGTALTSGSGTQTIIVNPDALSAATGSASISSPTEVGNPMNYGSSLQHGNPVAHILHAGAATLAATSALCPSTGTLPCTIIADPGFIYAVSALSIGSASHPTSLYIDHATVNCTGTVSCFIAAANNVSITGSGRGSALITMPNGTNGTIHMVAGTGISQFEMSDLTVDCNRANNTGVADGVDITTGTDIAVDRVAVQNCAGYGVEFNASMTRAFVRYSRFINVGANGTNNPKPLKTTVSGATPTTDVEYLYNYIDDTAQGAGGMKIAESGSGSLNIVTTIREIGNYIITTAGAGTTWCAENFAASGAGGGGQGVVTDLVAQGNTCNYTAPSVHGSGFSESGGTSSYNWKVLDNTLINVGGIIMEDLTPNVTTYRNHVTDSPGLSTLNGNNTNTPVWATCTAGSPTCTTFTNSGCSTTGTGDFIVGDGHSKIQIPGSGPGGIDPIYTIVSLGTSPPSITFDRNIATSVTCVNTPGALWGDTFSDNDFTNSGIASGLLQIGSTINVGAIVDAVIAGNAINYPNVLATGNTIRVSAGTANQIEHLVIRDNIFHDNTATPAGFSAVNVNLGKNVEVENNIMWESNRSASVFTDTASATNVTFAGNRCYQSQGVGACVNPLGTGDSIDGSVGSFIFAKIGAALPVNGAFGYCSDCGIASTCAGSGSGAIAKRLSGVNVCN